MTRRAAGFTLVELLVAISILAIVAVLGWRGLDGIIRARTALTLQLEATRGMQLAFAQMQSDCEHIANPQSLMGRPYLMSGSDRMTIVRNVFNENEPARLQVVAYRIVGGLLTRRESIGTRDLTELDVMWTAAISDIDTSAAVTLQSGVTAMQVQTWENNSWRQNTAPISGAGTGAGAGQLQGVLQAQGQAQQQALPPAAMAMPPTGLQVSLQVTGVEAVMNKSFLLGGL